MKKFIYSLTLLFFITLLIPSNSYAAVKVPGQDNYNNAVKLLNLKNYKDAVSNYDLAIKANPKYQAAFKGKGTALLYLGQFDKAVEAYNMAINLDSKDTDALILKAGALKYLGKYSDALALCNQALALEPKNALIYFAKGGVLNELQRYDEAIACFDKAAALNPKLIETNTGKGNTFLYKKEYEKALGYYEIVLKAKPSEGAALLGKGYTLYFIQKYSESIDNLIKASELCPPNADLYYLISCSHSMLGDSEKSIANLRKAIEMKKIYMLAARTEKAFDNLSKNNDFIELVYDAAESIKTNFTNSDIISQGELSGVKFLELGTTGDTSKDSMLVQIGGEYLQNISSGNIYNQNTASTCHIYAKSPFYNDAVKSGRTFKATSLVGLKATYVQTEGKIVYIGRLSGEIKIVVIKSTGNGTMDGTKEEYIDYLIFINNSGNWEYYGNFDYEDEKK